MSERQARLDERIAIMVEGMDGRELRELTAALVEEIRRRESPESAHRFIQRLASGHNAKEQR